MGFKEGFFWGGATAANQYEGGYLSGGKMLIDGIKAEDDEETGEFKLDLKELFLLAIATSIDALAVGITFTFLNYPIVECMSIIGCTTFIISFIRVITFLSISYPRNWSL